MKSISINISKRRALVCISLLIISCLFFIYNGLWQNALVVGALFLLLIPLSVQAESRISLFLIELFWVLLSSTTTFLIVQLAIKASVHAVGIYRISVNLLIIGAISFILAAITGNLRLSTLMCALLFLGYATVDYYVFRFRGR